MRWYVHSSGEETHGSTETVATKPPQHLLRSMSEKHNSENDAKNCCCGTTICCSYYAKHFGITPYLPNVYRELCSLLAKTKFYGLKGSDSSVCNVRLLNGMSEDFLAQVSNSSLKWVFGLSFGFGRASASHIFGLGKRPNSPRPAHQHRRHARR